MLIIQRHYLKEFFKLLSLIGTGLALIFSILELIDKIDDFMPNRPSLNSLLLYASFNFPKYLLYLLPMALLLCSLFTFSQANRRKEITAIRASGGRIKNLLMPFLFAGLFLSLFGFVLGELIMPDFSKKARELKNTITKKEKKFAFKEDTMWLRATGGSFVKIDLYLPEKKVSKGISIFRIENGYLKERIEAEEAEWEEVRSSNLKVKSSEGIWRLKKVIVYDIESGKISRLRELEYPYLESPDIFTEDIQKPEEMGIGELLRYTKKLKEAGFKNQKLIVDLNSKISYPLINFFMVLLGISLSMRENRGGGLVTAAIGLFISLLYWFSYTVTLSMGYAGIVPPVISTWLVPIIFGGAAVYLFRKIPE